MNCFTAIGRVGRDAVVRHTQAGKSVTGWALAVDTGFGDSKATTWLDCSLWGERGPKVAEHIRKGDRLGVVGEIGTREHDGKTYVTLNVREVTLLGAKRETESPPREQRAARPETARVDTIPDDDIPF